MTGQNLEKALAACKKQKAKLVIAKLDRLSRNLAFIATLMDSSVEFTSARRFRPRGGTQEEAGAGTGRQARRHRRRDPVLGLTSRMRCIVRALPFGLNAFGLLFQKHR